MDSDTDHASTTNTGHKSAQRRRVMQQVEFYLSEGNLARDRFFAEQMKKRPDNGILISMLLQCNRLQALKIDEDSLLRSIRKSSLVKVSEDGLAVVRTQPLRQLGPREKRTVLVVGIPRWPSDPDAVDQSVQNHVVENSDTTAANPSSGHSDIAFQLTQWLREVFSSFGEVLYISLPQYHTSGLFRGFAFIEFASPKEARLACKTMGPTADAETWFVAPLSNGATSSDAAVPENAWKPRLAARTPLTEKDMLARRYVWRCCSRKNKQIQAAFRHLLAAGYRAPNPCDREYELITLGASSPEVRETHICESYGEPKQDKLRVLRYPTWVFWKSKFYLWLQAWVDRMKRKTDELSMDLDAVQLDTPVPNEADHNQTSRNQSSSATQLSDPIVVGSQNQQDSNISLPKNYVPNSVILLFWPSTLVPVSDQQADLHPHDSTTELINPKPRLSLARRIRISLEHHLLSVSDLLDQVAHMDPQPKEHVLSEVLGTLGETPYSSSNQDTYPVFIRMKTKAAALTLIQAIGALNLPQIVSTLPLVAHLLSGENETAYCKAISSSLTGAAERRRRLQFKRRQRRKTESGDTHLEENNSVLIQSQAVSSVKRPKHIVFDE